MEAGLSLGSNQGNRLGHLRQAARRLAALPGVRILAKSRVYETEPVDVPEAYRSLAFLNAVVILEWPGSARELLGETQAIEVRAGRRRGERNGPRPLDIDIVYAGAGVWNDPDLTVPHPRARERRFVLEPLADVRPDWTWPDCGITVREVLAALPPGGVRVCEDVL